MAIWVIAVLAAVVATAVAGVVGGSLPVRLLIGAVIAGSIVALGEKLLASLGRDGR